MTGRSIVRFSFLLALLTGLLVVTVPSVEAHARLASSSISPGAILPAAPESITLTFTEAIDPAFSSAALVGSNQEVVRAVSVAPDPDDELTALFSIDDAVGLPPGSYALVWRVVSGVDGHATSGLLAFSAGTGSSPDIVSSSSTVAGDWTATIGRWLEFAGLMAIAGAAVLALIARDHSAALRTIVRLAAPIALTGGVLGAGALVATTTGDGWGAWPGWANVRHSLEGTLPGQGILARLALIGVILLISRFGGPRARTWTSGALALGASTALATFAITGHAAGLHGNIAVAVDLVHLIAAALWSGGLLLLALRLRTLFIPAATGTTETASIGHLIGAFSRLALAVFLLIVATGLTSASLNVSGPRNLTGESYGRFLILKTTLVLLILTAAAINRLLILPRLGAADSVGDRPGYDANLASLRRSTAVELGLALVVLFLAARITSLPPSDGPLTVDVAARSGPIFSSESSGDLTITLSGELRNRPGEQLRIEVVQAVSGTPVTDLVRLIVLATAPNPFDPGGAPLRDRFDAEPLAESPGSYVFPRSRLGVETEWNLEIAARRLGVEDEVVSFTLDLRATAPQPPRLVDETWRWPRLPWSGWLAMAAAAATAAGSLVLIRRLKDLEPVTAGVMLAVGALITIGFLLSAYRAGPPPLAGPAVEVPADLGEDAVIQRAAGLWAQQCAGCHGVDASGTGDPPEGGGHAHPSVAGDLLGPTVRARSSEELFWAISLGIGGTEMPAYDLALSERERWDLVAYLRWLQRQAGAGE